MKWRKYGGWCDEQGRGREVEVLTFVDERVAEIFETARRDELIQAVYRARPFDDQQDREELTIVLLSEMPIDGLRVDEMRFGGNAGRAEAKRGRAAK